jgi:hypothetical protein
MSRVKLGLLVAAALAVAVAAGFLWGAWGRWGLERQLEDTQLKLDMADARGTLFAARVDLAELNYGKAGATLDRARKVMESLATRCEGSGRADAAAAVREALGKAGEAQRFAAGVDQSAAGRVADALKALSRAEEAPHAQ